MKIAIIIAMTISTIGLSYGQRVETTFQVYSGLFSFGGASARKYANVYFSDVASEPSYILNPYGRGSGFSYGFGVQLQKVTSSHFLFGFQTNYESLSSKIKIKDATGEIGFRVDKGKAFLTNTFATINPFVGKRLELLPHLKTDFKIGLDFGIGLSSEEYIKIKTTESRNINGDLQSAKQQFDLRPRMEITNYYNRLGVSLGYAYGLVNYSNHISGENQKAKSRFVRLGLNYVIH